MKESKRLFMVFHWWSGEYDRYYVCADEPPTVEDAVNLCGIDYEPESGEDIHIEEVDVYHMTRKGNDR